MSTSLSNENMSSKCITICIRLCVRASEVQYPDIGHKILTVSIMLNMLNHPLAASIFVVCREREERIIEVAGGVAKCEYFKPGDDGVGEVGEKPVEN
jgi:hypothetical protein